MKILTTIVAALALSVPATSEDYKCSCDDGCPATKNEDGELVTETFRKGDMVSTEAGWVVSSDDGWVKIKTNNSTFLGHGNIGAVGVSFFSPTPSPFPWRTCLL